MPLRSTPPSDYLLRNILREIDVIKLRLEFLPKSDKLDEAKTYFDHFSTLINELADGSNRET